MSNDKTYNGWTNYKTWLVNLWLTNDAALVHAFGGLRDAVVSADTLYDAREILVAWLDNEYDMYIESNPHGLFRDLIKGALSEVDWYEIAKNWRDEE
jgi:hypothetical protein